MPFKLEGAADASPGKIKIEGAKDLTAKESSEGSFVQRVGQDISKRAEQEKTAIAEGIVGKQSLPSAALQTVGAGAGLIGDVGGEALKSAAGAVPNVIKQPIISAANKAANYIAGTDIGKSGIAKAVEAKQSWGNFAKSHPELAKDIAAEANIAANVPLSKAAGKEALSAGQSAAPYLESAGKSLIEKGEKQATERKIKDVIGLVSPKETKKIAEENVERTVEKGGLFRSKYVVPSPTTEKIASTVSTVPGINPNRSFQYNWNKIRDENVAESKKLMAALKASDAPIPIEKAQKAAQDIKDHLAGETFMVGDAKMASDKMIDKVKGLLKKNGYTASGMLKSRQEFDRWAKSQIKGIATSETNTARKATWQAVRNSMNALVEEAVPTAGVKESLTKQSHLFSALENIRPKAAAEGKNIVTRGVATMEDILPTKNQYLKHAVALTGAGLAATHPVTLAASVPYAGYKLATSPTTKKVIGKGLTTMSDILAP